MQNQQIKKRFLNNGGNGMQPIHKKGFDPMVDIVFVIGGTGSMQNALDAVKSRALTMYQDITEGLGRQNRRVQRMRVKVVVFRNPYVDTVPYDESPYFILTGKDGDEAEAFRSYVSSIRATGGGDEPGHALEALHRVFNGEFTKVTASQRARHFIVLLTDASFHPLNDPRRDLPEYANIYPDDMPRDMMELQSEYEDKMDHRARRLIVFAPSTAPWTDILLWSNVIYRPSVAGQGISDEFFQEVIDILSGSLS